MSPPARPDEPIGVELLPEERRVLRFGLLMWGAGPAAMTDEVARVLWFRDRQEFGAERDRLLAAIEAADALAPRDWHRVLAATEIGFISEILGAGGDWSIVSGIDDHTALDHIRSVQRTLASVRPWPEPYARPGHESS